MQSLAKTISITTQNLRLERGSDKSSSSEGRMSLTTQDLQARVHSFPPLLRLLLKFSQQDIGSVVDIKNDTLRALAADSDNNWPFKSAKPGRISSMRCSHARPPPRIYLLYPIL